MNNIAGIPYVEAVFDKNGTLTNHVVLPGGVTDLLIISHGWNNDEMEARRLYRTLFENFAAITAPDDLRGKSLAIAGVIWPSKKFDELVAVAGSSEASGAAGLSGDSGSLEALESKLESMKLFFAEPAQRALLDEAKALLPDLEDKTSARREFVTKIRALLDPTAADKEDASQSFFSDDGNELMKNLKVDEEDLDEEVAASAGGTASMSPVSPAGTGQTEGAADLRSVLTGFKAAAMNVLNYTTYFEMKARAGTVGKVGVAPLIDKLAPSVSAIHLIGHSFGGRLVTATAATSTTDKIRSMSLLQAAFSHNGFSRSMNGFFRSILDKRRVNGPILITHTKNDKAVGIAYPLASRINGDRAAKLGDENDVFGGIGRNGAQKMETGETVMGRLLAVGSKYAFAPRKIFNLEASDFVPDHGGVTGKEIAHALKTVLTA